MNNLEMRRIIRTMVIVGVLLVAADPAAAGKLRLPEGMGGVPDIGVIPCSVFSEMLVIGPLGTRLSLLTWANGYFYAQTRKTTDEILDAAAEQDWDFDRVTDQLVDYCEENPDALTREAVQDLGQQLSPTFPRP